MKLPNFPKYSLYLSPSHPSLLLSDCAPMASSCARAKEKTKFCGISSYKDANQIKLGYCSYDLI